MQNEKIRSILVIDDDRDDFELVAEAIKGIDPAISVFYLDRCEDGIKYSGQDFNLILLDINMPSHDGFDWLKGIRGGGYDTPIIMYTNSSSPMHIAKAYGEGATLYFNKPESYSLLVKAFRTLLALDWTNPFSIRNRYVHNGKCQTFEVA